jgi:hypothetical protein
MSSLEADPLATLTERLIALPGFELRGSALLDRRAAGETLDEAEILDATLEAIAYGEQCQKLQDQLEDLPSALLSAYPCPEYGL